MGLGGNVVVQRLKGLDDDRVFRLLVVLSKGAKVKVVHTNP